MGKKVVITPSKLSGKISVPPSKSISHRALICAALSKGGSEIKNLLDCSDTRATIEILTNMGAKISFENGTALIEGIEKPNKKIIANCRDSGSTLRFLMPVAAALGCEAEFRGAGKLPQRPVTPYLDEFEKKGVLFASKKMPYKISGKLKSGEFSLAGDISSQFVSGYMFALPLLDGDSEITLTSPLQSKPYADITTDILKKFGIEVIEKKNGYFIRGGQSYKPFDMAVDADMSQAAFFVTANALGAEIEIENLNKDSIQGDKAIIGIAQSSNGKAFDADASQIPDLVPILAVLASLSEGTSHITNCGRLRIKECDRLSAITAELNKLGAKITENSDNLVIDGVKALKGGECNSHNDHRIAMAIAIASCFCENEVIINGAECVNKSYPRFFEDFKALGGKINVIDN